MPSDPMYPAEALPMHGQKSVTLQDIADVCGVSKMTVSRALRGKRQHISPTTFEKIVNVAREMGYDPSHHHAARRLALSRHGQAVLNHVIGLFFPPQFYQFNYFNAIFRGLLDVFMAERYCLLTSYTNNTDPAPGEDDINAAPRPFVPVSELPDIFRRGDVDGALVLAHPARFSPLLERLRSEPHFGARPLVALMTPLPGCSTVLPDEFQGGYAATGHLLALGHRAIFRFTSDTQSHLTRQAGHVQAYLDRGIDPEGRLFGKFWHMHYRVSTEQTILEALRAHPEITAILAPNDMTAGMIADILRARNVRIPEDISLIGYDDTDPVPDADGQNILTTVHLPLVDIGRTAAHLIINRVTGAITEEQEIALPMTFITRGSTAVPRTQPLPAL